MQFRKSAQAIHMTEYHVILIFRYRRKSFIKGVKEYVGKLLSQIPELDSDPEAITLNV